MGDQIDRDKIYEAVYDLACKSVSVIGGISEDYAYGLREAAQMTGMKVFMKESLRGLMGEDFRQEFPWEE